MNYLQELRRLSILKITFGCIKVLIMVNLSTRKNTWQNKSRYIKKPTTRESCGIQPINEWVERRRREWDEHVTRMNAERLLKISRDNITTGRRSPES